MKKRLLLSAAVALTTMSGFALGTGEYLYTKDGRYKTTDDNRFAASLTTFDGFVAVPTGSNMSGTEVDWGKLFLQGTDADASLNYIQSASALADTDGIAYKLPASGASSLLVSMKLKASGNKGIYKTDCSHSAKSGMNLIRLVSVEKGADIQTAAVVAYHSTPFMVTSDWTTVAFAVDEVEDAYDYYLEIFGTSEDMQIADISVNAAEQVADLRVKEAWLNKANAYLNLQPWTEAQLEDTGLAENIVELKKIDDDSTPDDLQGVLDGLKESITGTEGIVKYMDNWLGTDAKNLLSIHSAKMQGSTTWGIWTYMKDGAASNRLYAEGQNTPVYPEGPHGNGVYGDIVSSGLETTNYQELPAGKYVFSVEMNASQRMWKSKLCWDVDEAMEMYAGQLYVTNEAGDTIAKTDMYDLPAGVSSADGRFVSNTLTWILPEAGKYKIGMVARRKDGFTNNGGTTTFKDATLYFVSDAEYTKAEMDYIGDVKEQITTGRDNITTANDNIASTEKYWGKPELQACLDTAVAKVEAYEAYTDAQIVETFDKDTYVKSTSEETGLLVYQVYQSVVKDLIAANRTFNAKNDTINMLETAIAQAKALLTDRVYAAATQGAQLENEIATAETLLSQMKATEYSEENAASIKNEIEALATAKNVFVNSIEASKLATLVDIDFSGTVTYDADEENYGTTPGTVTIAGKSGSMTISNFMTTTPPNDLANSKGVLDHCSIQPFELGIDDNDTKVLPDVLHVGSGTGDVEFDASDMGSDILKISMDFWMLRLSGGYIGFYVNDENNQNVSGFRLCTYNDGTTYNPLNMSFVNGKSGYTANTADNAGAVTDGNKTNIVLYLDYGTKKAKMVSTIPAGVTETEWVDFDGTEVKTFQVHAKVNGGYNGRRCWFDNLKIERISADAPDAVSEVKAADAQAKAAAKKVVNGQLVIETAKGTFNAAGAQVK